MEQNTLLKMVGITKTFPGVKALDGVNLEVKHGTVHALMGENGAGKSTLMKCLFGMYAKDGGQIYLDSSLIDAKVEREDVEVFYLPATQLAKDNEISTLGNMIMIGHVLENNSELSFAGTEAVVQKLVPASKQALVGLNMKALSLGKEYKA